MSKLWAAALVALASYGGVACGGALPPSPVMESFRPVTREGAAISDLFLVVMGLSAAVLVVVVVPLVYATVRYRAAEGAPDPPQVEGNRVLEVAWTGGAFLLVAALFISGVSTMRAIDSTGSPAVRVQVIGHQWWWEFQYPDEGVATANELHLPTNAASLLEITSADVIHSFWVPRLGWKQDGTPGRITTMWVTMTEPGTYVGACTEFCGLQHAWMRTRVIAEPKEQFDAWLRHEQQAASPTRPAASAGAALFQGRTCANCHTIRGTPSSSTIGPDLTHFGARSTIGAGVLDNTPENLRRWIRDVHAIKPGALMPAFTALSDEELATLVAYLRGLD